MIVGSLFVAALALYVWLAVEQGLNTRVGLQRHVGRRHFNFTIQWQSALCGMTAYYILSDVRNPKLAQRATAIGSSGLQLRILDRGLPGTSPGRAGETLTYAPASFYTDHGDLAIAVFIASEYLAVGVAIALWEFLRVVLPIGKALWQSFRAHACSTNRTRAVITTSSLVLLASIALFWIPVRFYATTEGVVWLPESANVRAEPMDSCAGSWSSQDVYRSATR